MEDFRVFGNVRTSSEIFGDEQNKLEIFGKFVGVRISSENCQKVFEAVLKCLEIVEEVENYWKIFCNLRKPLGVLKTLVSIVAVAENTT